MSVPDDHTPQPSQVPERSKADLKAYSGRAASDPSYKKYWGDMNIAVAGYGQVHVYVKEEGFKASFEGTVYAVALMAGGYTGALETENIDRVYADTHHFQVTNEAAAIQI